MKRPTLRMEPLEARQLLATDTFMEGLLKSDLLPTYATVNAEGLFGGPRTQDVPRSSEFLPRLHPESNGGLLGASSVPTRNNTANLSLTSGVLADGAGVPQSQLLVGQQIVLRADWTSINVANFTYTVGFFFNGIRLDSGTINGAAGGASYWWYRYGSFASPGTHTLRIVLDPDNVVPESNENDNSITLQISTVEPTNLPSKFQTPIGREANRDWAITNYADVDPRGGFRADYRGGPFQYDGHNAIDAGPWGFSSQDDGIPILAAAGGWVDAVQDGYFDRETSMGNRPGNFVRINHGNGFKTLYYHFATNSITVQVGQSVRAGQLLGHMGSSGSSTGSHLHYTPFYRDAPIETGYAPSVYNLAPLPYGGDVAPFFFDTGITNRMVDSDTSERVSDNSNFAQGSTGTVAFWLQAYNLKSGDVLRWRYFRPDGSLWGINTFTLNASYSWSWWYWNHFVQSFSSTLGNWRVEFSINDVVSQSKTFTISPTGSAAIRMTGSGIGLINSKRTTPIDYGIHSGGTPTRTFTIENHGTTALQLGKFKLPRGFNLVGSFPQSISAGGSASFTVALDTAIVGNRFGAISFNTNDPDVPLFWFNVSGRVSGSDPGTSITLSIPGPSSPYYYGGAPVTVAPAALVDASAGVDLRQATLRIEVDNAPSSTDFLSVTSNNAGSNNPILSITGGKRGEPLLIQFNNLATKDTIARVLKRVMYSSSSDIATYSRRYIRVTLTDSTGTIVGDAIAHIIPGGKFEAPSRLDGSKSDRPSDRTSDRQQVQALAVAHVAYEMEQERLNRSRNGRIQRV